MNSKPICSRYKKLTGEKLHEYLVQLININSRKSHETIQRPSDSSRNVDELMKFLKDSKSFLKFGEQSLFYNQCMIGYILERVFYLHKEKHQKKEIKEPFSVFLTKYSDISASYSRKLRTVGKIWNEYKGLGNLAISFTEFYQRKDDIILLFKNHDNLAEYWKNDIGNDNDDTRNGNLCESFSESVQSTDYDEEIDNI